MRSKARISHFACVSGCGADGAVRPGALLRVRGTALRRTAEVEFAGLPGEADDVATFERSVALQNSLGVPSRMMTAREAGELAPLANVDDVLAATICMRDGHANTGAVVEGYAYGDLARGAEGVKLALGVNDQANLDKLLRGDVDYMLVDDLLIRYVLAHQREEAEAVLAVGNKALMTRSLHLALRKDLPGAETVPVSVRSGAGLDELRAALDRAAARVPGRAGAPGELRLPASG